MLRKFVRQLLKGLCGEIMKGNVAIKPYKKQATTSCKYCGFTAVCQFDPVRAENSFKPLYDREDEEIWGLVAEDCNNGESGVRSQESE